MFRASQSVEPASNKLLQERWDASKYMSHRQRVKNAKTTVENKVTHDYRHIHTKAKKRLDEERQYAEIEKGNRRLVEHMTHIMYSKGRVDHFNEPYVNRIPSLSYDKRKREMERIQQENAGMIKRLGEGRGCYSNAKLAQDWRANERYMTLSSSHRRPRQARSLAALDRLQPQKSQDSLSDLSVTSSEKPSLFNPHRPLPRIGAIPEEAQAEATS
eukprot:m.5974 g.5974  ORF g.5974 m.5974 type:complete len:215 (+) comp14603_c0_seq1:50-694(+)